MDISSSDSISHWGLLPPVPRYDILQDAIPDGPGREGFQAIFQAVENLSRAVQLGNHRRLVQDLSLRLEHLGPKSLMEMAVVALDNVELCTALSVYLTCLEQTYHWPHEIEVTTPVTLNTYKILIQVFHEPELRVMLDDFMLTDESFRSLREQIRQRPYSKAEMTLGAQALASKMFAEATDAKAAGTWPLVKTKQDKVNLLNRTARGDIWDQGGYASLGCHKEMGRLHEMARTNGTQRRCQEIFQEAGGVSLLQNMPTLLGCLDQSPASRSSLSIADALMELQVAVARSREELFTMVIDEVIWGCTFAKWSKAYGISDVGSSGSDCPLFWMLDSFIGRADIEGQAILPNSLAYRSRFFPPDVTALTKALASSPSLRSHVYSGYGQYALVQAWKGFQHILHDLYDIHRKKAMRIILALRAGRGKTSSGVQKAASPEGHLSATLYEALAVRFGQDLNDLNIDAYAWPSPLLVDSNGCVKASRVRFVFSTPLVVSPGDTVVVSLPLPNSPSEEVRWHERVYSITFIGASQWTRKPVDRLCQLADYVEVCVGSQGQVSKYICQQQAGFPVNLRIKASPHFRLQGNPSPQRETIFVAQGGAVGVFVSWLARQQTLVGRYRLIVGVGDASMLAYSNVLQQLVHRFGPALRVVAALSRPGKDDVRTLLSSGIKPFNQKVPIYLSLCSLPSQDQLTWYICGSAEFRLVVAKAIKARLKARGETQVDVGPFGSRLSPIITSELPPVRLHVAGSSTRKTSSKNGTTYRIISRTELSLHNQPDDLWIALEDRVFDISTLPSFHPGGEKVLAEHGGRDARGMMDTIHKGSYMVETMLDSMFIGWLAPASISEWENIADSLVRIQNDLQVQSRFEQTPTGSPTQQDRAPPAEIIRSSLHGLVRSWNSKFSAELSGSEDTVALLDSALDEVTAYFDRVQATAYDEHFADVARCAATLKYVHECHYTAISKIHRMIDDMKTQIFESIEVSRVSPEKSLLIVGTHKITQILRAISTMGFR
ncbi:hypothetical protein LX32DRAFT_715089 [Colletotrichum zoysiae]|uniref:Cytochrome b5 heme-binding domain-containing protein n=1 Tax=Colletotrichum zoysiae TaxID=1216348 RepID=A0AAD9LWC9_9PEZI|nr:hypothetical protein LX32DRAFT_715089 [Colletotrichum zoysiae]